MSDFSKFRSSLGGFNRADVANYIESSSIEHQKELRRLKDESEKLTAENASLAAELTGAKDELAAAKSTLETLQAENDSLRGELEALRAEAAAPAEPEAAEPETAEEPEAPQDAAPAGAEEDSELKKQELTAYRRAEAAERNAALRARKLREQLSELSEHARSRCSDSGEELTALTDDLTGNLDRLKETIAELRLVFDETEDAFDSIELPDVPAGEDA